MAQYPTAKCPQCKKKRLWFGEGKPTEPCRECYIEQVPVDADNFFEGAEQSTDVSVVRTGTSTPVQIGKKYVEQSAQRHFYKALVKTKQGWKYFTYSEVLVADGWGYLGPEGSMWNRLREAEISPMILRNRSGAF